MNDLVRGIQSKFAQFVMRGIIETVKQDNGIQLARVSLRADETRDNIERLETAGLTSMPADGTECMVMFLGGDLAHGVVIGEIDTETRPAISAGEARLYAPADGTAQVAVQSGGKVAIGTNVIELLEEISKGLNAVATGIVTIPSGGGTSPLSTAATAAAAKTAIDTIKGSF